MTARDLDSEAWIRWVDRYCPFGKLCSGPHDLSGLCQVEDRELAAVAARAWLSTVKYRRNTAERVYAAERMAAQWAEIRAELSEQRENPQRYERQGGK